MRRGQALHPTAPLSVTNTLHPTDGAGGFAQSPIPAGSAPSFALPTRRGRPPRPPRLRMDPVSGLVEGHAADPAVERAVRMRREYCARSGRTRRAGIVCASPQSIRSGSGKSTPCSTRSSESTALVQFHMRPPSRVQVLKVNGPCAGCLLISTSLPLPSHQHWGMAVDRRPVPELAREIHSPAIHPTIAR